MKGILSCLFSVGAVVLLPTFHDAVARSAEADVEQWTRFETTFTNSRDYENSPQTFKTADRNDWVLLIGGKTKR